MMWYIRWQITRGLVSLAFWIAPRSPTRDLYIATIDTASQHIIDTIGETPND